MTATTSTASDDAKQEHRIAKVKAYAEQIAAAKTNVAATVDKGSIEIGSDLLALYEAMAWVKDSTVPTPKAGKRGPKVNPKSQAQFYKWASINLSLSASYSKRLLPAAEWVRDYGDQVTAIFVTERAVRPLLPIMKDASDDEITVVCGWLSEWAEHREVSPANARSAAKDFWDLPEVKKRQKPGPSPAVELEKQISKLLDKLVGSGDARRQIAKLRKRLDELTAAAEPKAAAA